MERTRRAAVFCKGKRAGLLRKTAGGYEFSYEALYLSDPDAVPISLDGAAQKFTGAEDVALAGVFFQCAGPHPGRQRFRAG